MRRKILWLLLICGMLLQCYFATAQSVQLEQTVQNNIEGNSNTSIELIIEKIVNNINREDDSDDEYCYELTLYLFSIASSGLVINTKGVNELEFYGLLTSFEAHSLKTYFKVYREPLSFAELLIIPGVDREKIKLLHPFLKFPSDYYSNEGPSCAYSSLLMRSSVILEKKEGYTPILKEEYLKKPESRYLGAPYLLYGQYSIDMPRNISATITAEKDPGERGVDFISWSASLKNRGALQNLIIGSYTARKGQGLILWNAFSLSSSFDPANSLKRNFGITPYTSVQEDRAFKGVAATISRGKVTLELLSSFRNYDARTIENGYTSLLVTGLHNTPLTLEREGALHTNMAAMSINYNNEIFNVGGIFSASYNSLPYAGRDSSLFFMEQKMGQYRANYGVNWRGFIKKSIVSGEVAFDMGGNAAAITGVAVRLKSGSELSFIAKYYSSYFVSPFSYLSKIPGGNQLLVGVSGKFSLAKNCVLYASANWARDYYKIVVKYDISNKSELRLSLYKERLNFRADYRKKLSRSLLLHSRVDFTGSNKEDEFSMGYLFQEELVATVFKERMGFSCRISWFNAPLWSNRIYSYERDVLNQFRTTLIYGQGFRWYVNMKATLGTKVDLWIKYSCTYYTDREKIGEGPEMISGPAKSEVKAELRVKF